MIETFKVGEAAFHPNFGWGTVLKVTQSGDEQGAEIQFDDRTRSCMSSFLSHEEENAAARFKAAQDQVRLATRQRRAGFRVVQGGRRKPDKVEPFELTFFNEINPNVFKEWTVEDWLGHGELVVPYGAPGCGKSVLMGDMACHIGAGWDWFGKKTQLSSVLYVAAERATLVERRFAAFRKHHGIDDLPVAVIKGYFDLGKAKVDTDRIIATVKRLVERTEITSSVVIIDTKRQVIGDENSDDVGRLVGNIARIQHETESGVIVIDHSPFHSPTKPSGRGELVAAADATFLVEKVGDVRTARIVKANDGPDDLALAFDLTSVGLGTHPDTGRVTTAPVVVSADQPEPRSPQAGRLTNSEKIALSALEEALAEGGEKSTSEHVPASARVVSVSLWREYAYRRGISDADGTEARRKAFQRAKLALVAKKRIGLWNENAWLTVASPDISALLALGGTRDKDGTLSGQVHGH